MKIGTIEALRALEAASDSCASIHQQALNWLRSVPAESRVIWLPRGWATNDGEVHASSLVSSRALKRIRRAQRSNHLGLRLRALHILDERAAIQLGVRGLLGDFGAFPSSDLFVRYTRLGQPVPGWRGGAAALGKRRGIRRQNLHISFSHDGDAVLAIAAHGEGLRGVGIDAVQLDRLRGKGRDYLHRFARHFMSESEFKGFDEESAQESDEETLLMVSAHFSLMESASKALGTGLKIGGGMGKPESLPKQSIGIRLSADGVAFLLETDAKERLDTLGASVMAGYFSADSEYLVSAVYLLG